MPRSHSKQKWGGSKKGKSGSTWNEEPDEVIHNYVKECLSCHKVADEAKQKIVYTKRINELPEQVQISLQEHHVYKHECECGKTTQAADPTLEGTSLGSNLLSFLSSARQRTGGSFENLALMIYLVRKYPKQHSTGVSQQLANCCYQKEIK